MSYHYKEAMEHAGATIHYFESFGSYQGDWWARATYQGKTGWIHGSYGSCSGCDAFQAEFDFEHHEHGDDDYYKPLYDGFRDNCEKCQDVKKRLIRFGENYLDGMMTQDKAIEEASRNLDWDMDAQKMVDFIKYNAAEEN
jgi:hypothetical protein